MTPEARFARRSRAVCLGMACLCAATAVVPAVGQTTSLREPTLREQLVFGLRARLPSEFAFIDAVVDTVERGDLPESVVIKVFAYARSRQRRVRRFRPIIFFTIALNEVTSNLQITIAPDA